MSEQRRELDLEAEASYTERKPNMRYSKNSEYRPE